MSRTQTLHNVNGTEISVVTVGEGSPALLFLHYWGGSTRTWAPVMEELSETNRCIAIDFRGWGESSKKDTDYSLQTLAADVLSIVRNLRLERFLLLGHSMGGKVAQLVAAQQPAGLKQLILMAPAPPIPLEVPEQDRQGYVASYESPEGVKKVIEILSPPERSEAFRKKLDQYHGQIAQDTLCGSPGAKRAWPERGMIEDIREQVSRITVPVQIIVGSADNVETETSLRKAFGTLLPRTDFTVIHGADHMAPLEASVEVVSAIRTAQGALVAAEKMGAGGDVVQGSA